MDNELPLKRNQQMLGYQIGLVVALGLVFFILATSIFRAFDDLLTADTSILTRLARWIILAMTIMAVLAVRANKRRIAYSATSDSIIVSKRIFGSYNKDIYAIREVSSVSLRQSFLGSKLNYGDIIVRMNRMGRSETLTLKDIEDPRETLIKLETRVKNIKR